MTTEQAKQLDIVAYLELNNIHPARVKGHQYWYSSPFRNERTPSFKVNRLFNLWYDFGEGKGGTLIDLGIRLENCTVKDFLTILDGNFMSGQVPVSFEPPNHAGNTNRTTDAKTEILSVHLISCCPLIRYLQQRKIGIAIADKYLQEVRYRVHGKIYYALGFLNDRGGYELRSPYFKGASSPKGITFIDNSASELSVFEGFFDFLSYLCFRAQNKYPNENYLVLNSLAFFERQLSFMQQYSTVHLYLDNDDAGNKVTAIARSLGNEKFIDERKLFMGYKDLNDWWLVYSSA